MGRLNLHFVVAGPAADFHMYSLLVHQQEVHQAAEMFAVDQAEVDREEEAVEHNREERTTVVGKFERLVGRNFVYFEGMRFDLAEARQEDTCSGYKLPALVDSIVEGQSGIRRIDLSWILAEQRRRIHFGMSKLDV
jgi:hypothetical protein